MEMADPRTLSTYETMAEHWTELREAGEVLGHSRIERPAMLYRLPDVRGRDVVCLGCGSSGECQLLAGEGARRVLGIDASESLLQIARAQEPDAEFARGDLDDLQLPAHSFDLAWAALSLHYAEDFPDLLSRIYWALRPGGQLLCSLPHPVYYGADRERWDGGRHVLSGFEQTGTDLTVHGDCLTERVVSEKLQGKFPVSFHLRGIGATVGALIEAGFRIDTLDEPAATPPLPSDDEDTRLFIERHQRIPLVFVVLASKVGSR